MQDTFMWKSYLPVEIVQRAWHLALPMLHIYYFSGVHSKESRMTIVTANPKNALDILYEDTNKL